MANTVVIKLNEGSELIADKIDESETHITVKDVGRFMMAGNNGEVAVVPFSPFTDPKETISLSKLGVLCIMTPSQQVKNEYERTFSKVMTPPEGIITGSLLT
jgi:hypothetical protein